MRLVWDQEVAGSNPAIPTEMLINSKLCSLNIKKYGEVAEWSNAAVLKTVDLHGSGGSNPSLSAFGLVADVVIAAD